MRIPGETALDAVKDERCPVVGVILRGLSECRRSEVGHSPPGSGVEHLVDNSYALTKPCLQHGEERAAVVGGERSDRPAPVMVTDPVVMNAAEEPKAVFVVGLVDVVGLGKSAQELCAPFGDCSTGTDLLHR